MEYIARDLLGLIPQAEISEAETLIFGLSDRTNRDTLPFAP